MRLKQPALSLPDAARARLWRLRRGTDSRPSRAGSGEATTKSVVANEVSARLLAMEPAGGKQGPECAAGSRHESAAPADAARARLAPTAGDRLPPERIG